MATLLALSNGIPLAVETPAIAVKTEDYDHHPQYSFGYSVKVSKIFYFKREHIVGGVLF